MGFTFTEMLRDEPEVDIYKESTNDVSDVVYFPENVWSNRFGGLTYIDLPECLILLHPC